MANGIKTLYAIRDKFPTATRLILLNALVFSRLQHSVRIQCNLTNWLKRLKNS